MADLAGERGQLLLRAGQLGDGVLELPAAGAQLEDVDHLARDDLQRALGGVDDRPRLLVEHAQRADRQAFG